MKFKLLLAGSSVLGAVIGAAATYVFLKKTIEDKYSTLSETEIAQAKTYYSMLYKKDGFTTPAKTNETLLKPAQIENIPVEFDSKPSDEILGRVISGLRYGAPKQKTKKEPITAEVTVNIFDEGVPEDDSEVDYTEEEADRSPNKPYIISMDEFMNNESGYIQTTLSFYKGDGVVAGEDDEPLDDVNRTVGYMNIEKFGHRSGDKNVVYIRNDRLQMEYEIIRANTSYGEVVAGFTKEGI